MDTIYRVLLITALLAPGSVFSSVPGQVNFQGVLLDNTNQAVNGSVDFDFAIYDAAAGGSQLWTESQLGVSVTAGMYTVSLGSVTPLTVNVLSGAAVFLEVSVDGEALSPRQRLLAVPYALKAEEAEKIAGVSGIFVQQLFQHVDWDGQSIANDDPLEGVADTDGDGLANFIDPDNDEDGITDDDEISGGTGVNLVTPVISTISGPHSTAAARAGEANTVTITGSGFVTGLSVQVGTENPVAQNVTSSSFDISVGVGQVSGPVAVTITNSNAESASGAITFYDKLVFISSGGRAGALNQRVTEADAFCAQSATAAGLNGSFVAWYSDPDNSISAKDRIPLAGGPWARLDGIMVAADHADLTDGTIAAGISVDEYGVVVDSVAATNSFASGDFDPNSCFGTSTSSGYAGSTDQVDNRWSHGAAPGCFTTQRYYCFEE